MEAPGSSIFAGAGSLHIDRSALERLEEQEDLEDRQRRAVELKANLDHAFDDFVDDDEPSSVNSSHERTSLEASRALQHNANMPGAAQTRNRNPPTYIESLSHLKDTAAYDAANQPHEGTTTPSQGYQHYEVADMRCSPCGAGDAQENCYHPNDYRGHLIGQHNGVNSYEAKQQQLNYEQLSMMYKMRVKECQQLAEQLVELQRGSETETDALRARLAAALSDTDQAQLSLQQTQHLLATSKHQILELQQQISEQKEAAARAVADKERVAQDLHATALALQEAQQRLQTVQLARNHDTDVLFREQQDRHREECEHLREDLERAKNRLEEKEKEASVVERRWREAERAREAEVVERGAVVNRLAAELEAAQAQARPAARQVKELGARLERTAAEVVAARQEAARARREHDEWRAQLRHALLDAAPDALAPGSDPASPGKLATLKEVLVRYKQQGNQINKLTEELNTKDKKLESCLKAERELRCKLEEKQAVEVQLSSHVEILQRKLEVLAGSGDADLLDSYKHQNQQLEAQLDELRSQLKTVELSYAELELQQGRLRAEREADAEVAREAERQAARAQAVLQNNNELKSLYLQVCSARDALSHELKEANSKLSELQRETVALRKRERTSAEREGERSEHLSSDFSAEGGESSSPLSSTRQQKSIKEESAAGSKQNEPCKRCATLARDAVSLHAQIQQYKIKIEAQESNEHLLRELRGKAEYFQQYIARRTGELRARRHVATNTDAADERERRGPEGRDRSLSPEATAEPENEEDDSFQSRTDMLMKEKHIREQIAEQYTMEIKSIEVNCAKRIDELQKENAATITKLRELLEKKAQEVEVLKKFVVSERAKITEVLQAKEKEIDGLFKANDALQEEYGDLRRKATELERRVERSEARGARARAELERRAEAWGAEREAAARAHAELAERARAAERQHEQLREKYRTVKKTALGYKEYASKKDAHVETELERIKSHYETELSHLREQLQRVVKQRREIQVNERLGKMQSELDAMVSEVGGVS